MAFDIKKLQKDITALNKEFAAEFHKMAEDSRNKVMLTLKPGQTAPAANKIYGEDNRELFSKKAADIRSRGYALIESAKADLQKQIAEAPTQDAVNAVAMLSHRSKVTEREIDNLLQEYGSNYQTYQAIRDIAARHDVLLPTPDIEKDYMAIDGELRTVQAFTLMGAENGTSADNSAIAFREVFNNMM